MSNFVNPFMGLLSLILNISGIQLIRGKWLFLIAGYNTMTENEKKHYNGDTLGKLVGSYLLVVSLVCLFSKVLPLNFQLIIIVISTIFILLLSTISTKGKV
ncbi:DUF3784 domain-containing protein [Enterococcus alishanensis]|uniref:DUF3784 domain-containing protein n=2 Tax=Enterococcus alishanensis TaxID=1303817 RepID=A0ABS6TH04_9ENTE|nr:DUF3784 domain-containing protein [Enterococcus alishanensis]